MERARLLLLTRLITQLITPPINPAFGGALL